MIRLRAFVENNLYMVAGIALGVAVAQLLGISKLNCAFNLIDFVTILFDDLRKSNINLP